VKQLTLLKHFAHNRSGPKPSLLNGNARHLFSLIPQFVNWNVI
jgi:hypothetical protein